MNDSARDTVCVEEGLIGGSIELLALTVLSQNVEGPRQCINK